ncbi:hypothetical protein LPJ76_006008 [Coemansia sp. RSA 638]|nr:hypothetical protein LPJ76_006008 [Coemansia sp. RSA 638]
MAKLARENAEQRKKIAELEATIEQLKFQHDQDLEIINKDLTQLAIWSAKEKALEATVRDQFIGRAVKAEVRARRLTADLAAIQDKQADRLVQLVDKRSNKLAGKAVDCHNILEKGLVQPADERSNGLRHLIVKLRMVRASKANSLMRDSMLADKLAVKQTIPEVLYDQVGATKNKITRYKEMAHKIVELLRAHQCRHQLNNQKPESNCNNSSKKRMSFFENIGQSATLCTMATAHTSAGSRF